MFVIDTSTGKVENNIERCYDHFVDILIVENRTHRIFKQVAYKYREYIRGAAAATRLIDQATPGSTSRSGISKNIDIGIGSRT